MLLEAFLQKKLAGFLDGPLTLQLSALKRSPSRRYRSSTLALLAWIVASLRCVLAPVTLCLFPALLVIILHSMIAIESPVRIWVLVILAIIAVQLLLGILFHPRVKIERTLPPRVMAGSRFSIQYRIRSKRWLPTWDLRADPFRFTPELITEHYAEFPYLPRKGEATTEATVRATRRGRCIIYGPRVESTFPFGFFCWSSGHRRSRNILNVYPAFIPLRRFELTGVTTNQANSSESSSRLGDDMEVVGARDYREGDDIRWIDWPASARTGEFVVKKFADDEQRRTAIFVDTFIPHPGFWTLRSVPSFQPQLEATLSVVVAIAEYLSRNGATVEFLSTGVDIWPLHAERSDDNFDEICDILGGVESSRELMLPQLGAELLQKLNTSQGAVIILMGVDEYRRQFVKALQETAIPVRVLVVSESAIPELPPDWKWLTPSQVQEGEVMEI